MWFCSLLVIIPFAFIKNRQRAFFQCFQRDVFFSKHNSSKNVVKIENRMRAWYSHFFIFFCFSIWQSFFSPSSTFHNYIERVEILFFWNIRAHTSIPFTHQWNKFFFRNPNNCKHKTVHTIEKAKTVHTRRRFEHRRVSRLAVRPFIALNTNRKNAFITIQFKWTTNI